ncbi:Cdc6/Cdc18 family protein [Natronomonas sp.]|uniref:Cdc6/Cdc18 family protein n=1 Tax=Natronomonas sp. TaxID=2184060 RepID=UPI002FC386D1
MIRDARVLQPDFVPQEVVYRDAEVNQLSNALEPITRDEPAETAFLFGPSGTGKTCLAQFTVERLREEVIDINHQYVNCWQNYTRFRTIYRILEGLGQTLDVHRQSTPKDELLERLRTYDGPPYVVILDEVDQLEDTDVLYDLYQLSNITMVLVANREEELFARVDDRLTSRLMNCTRIRFDKYGLDELASILEARVRWGLTEDAIDRDQLERISDAAAGDARIAIGILRNAARYAERQGLEQVNGKAIVEAIPDAKEEVQRKDIETLTPDQRTLYEVVREHGEITPGELYDAYTNRVDDPKTKRTVRNYMTKMDHYNLIVAEGENRGRHYRLADQ